MGNKFEFVVTVFIEEEKKAGDFDNLTQVTSKAVSAVIWYQSCLIKDVRFNSLP